MQKVNETVKGTETSKPVSGSDIAKTVGCSASLVSRVLAGKSRSETAGKIREAARKMNYVPCRVCKAADFDIADLQKIPVPASPVTSFDELGKLVGVSGTNLNKYYYGKKGSPEIIAYVRAAAERFGYVPGRKPKRGKTSGYVSAKDVAQRTGYAVSTVYNALESAPNSLSSATVQKIRDAAREMGYDPARYQPPHTGKQNPHAYLKHSNFPSPEVEKERMEILRRQGYTNEEIAQKIGKSYLHVLTKIGTQPKAITQMSYAAAAANRRFRKQLRERYQLQGMLDEYIAAEAELEQMKAKESALKAKIVELKPHVDRAGQLDQQISSK